jgi:hypothetical protein
VPRYFFHLQTSGGLRRDGIGLELDGPQAARDVARAAVEMSRCLCQDLSDCRLHVADECGRTLMPVPFAGPAQAGAAPPAPRADPNGPAQPACG